LFQLIFDNILGDFTIGIIEVSEHPDPCHTGRHASRLLALLNEFDAEAALLDIAFLFNDPNIIRTSGDAIFTADAFILIHQNHSILPFMGGSGGTDLDTGRVITMLALNGEKFAAVIREFPVLALFKMVISLLVCKTVLVMAGHTTGVTTHTLCFINDHPISSHNSPIHRLFYVIPNQVLKQVQDLSISGSPSI
jgi:hypothetical protein